MVNHIPQALDTEAFRYTLEAQPRVISFTLGDPGDLVRQAHAVGSRVMLQVTTVAQAVQAAERGVGVMIAQGGESGGYCGDVSTMALVLQVVDAVSPIPVVASGGIFDGRGIAAALMLGAVGVNLGARFIASKEAPGSEEWKQATLHANSRDSSRSRYSLISVQCRARLGSARFYARYVRHSLMNENVRRRAASATA